METHPSSKNVIALYERHAACWDEDRGKALVERSWLDRFTTLLPRAGTVLDLGCGSGEPIAAYLIRNHHVLTGVDSSASMIALCLSRFPDHRWLTGDMRHVNLATRFDAILAWDSFFHLTPDDQCSMFRIFAAHAHKGTALMFTSGPKHGEAIGAYRGEDLYHASLAPEAYRELLESTGFRVVAHKAEDEACGGRTVWLAMRR
jgi:SAM-dependent methyltransferase